MFYTDFYWFWGGGKEAWRNTWEIKLWPRSFPKSACECRAHNDSRTWRCIGWPQRIPFPIDTSLFGPVSKLTASPSHHKCVQSWGSRDTLFFKYLKFSDFAVTPRYPFSSPDIVWFGKDLHLLPRVHFFDKLWSPVSKWQPFIIPESTKFLHIWTNTKDSRDRVKFPLSGNFMFIINFQEPVYYLTEIWSIFDTFYSFTDL